MDTAIIKTIRERAKKNGAPLIIDCDNERVFYDNAKDQFPIIWDDASESFTAITVNNDLYNQSRLPFTMTTTDYSMIQYMVEVSTMTDVIDYYGTIKSKLSDNEQEAFSTLLARAGRNSVSIQNLHYHEK